MTPQRDAGIKLTTIWMRRVLLLASALVFAVGITLNLLPEQTARYFAWTVDPPLTAAFLGAGYWSSFVLEYLASRQRVWARARIAVPAVFIFTVLTLVATLVHIDRFHLGAQFAAITQIGTWAWIAVYAVVPPLMLAVWLGQTRRPGGDPPRLAPMPGWIRLVVGLQAIVLLLLGAGLFLAPLAVAPLWPWKLTALTGRAVGAWLVGLGAAAVQFVWEDDWMRVPAAVASYTIFGALELLALLRFAGTLNWGTVQAWLYLLFLLSILFAGAYSWRAARRAEQREPLRTAGLYGNQ